MYLYNKDETFYIDASDYLGHDAPKQLLRALIEITTKERGIDERWICWHDEPGANILRLYHNDNLIGIQIYDTYKPSYELENDDNFLKSQVGKLQFDMIVEKKLLIKEILYTFTRIVEKMGIQSYEENWFEFPYIELEELKKISIS